MDHHPQYVFWIGYCLSVSNQKEAIRLDHFWLAHQDLDTHLDCLEDVGFWFSLMASSRPLGRIFNQEAWEEARTFRPLCCMVWQLSSAIFWVKITSVLARCWGHSQIFPPFHYFIFKAQLMVKTKSNKNHLHVKYYFWGKRKIVHQVRQFNFYLALVNTYI